MATGFERDVLEGYAREKRSEYEGVLKKIVEIPSVSVEPERRGEVRRTAEYAVSLLESCGAKAKLYETKGHPIVHGRFERGPSYPTVTIYNHLDVQPAEGDDWKTMPFEFVREGDRYFGRGTTDDKGPAMTALFGARYAKERGVPLNIHFLWELEEEIGSPS
ncbi:MAG TPA: M20/M25/M40 family metallo-hydrolase, partial [Thermoanaerobaculia bacterium]|nr:M20/M25/M40 family metallo-hydrolase [Thermoanaerobaculia bacterium]